MIRYKKYKASDNTLSKGKWYAKAVTTETVDLDGLAQHMATHNTPYSQGCIKGVLRDMADCIKELLIEGKSVKLDELAIFSVGIVCKGADTAAEFTASNIKGYRLNARATGQLRPQTMTAAGELKAVEYGTYSVADSSSSSSSGGTSSGSGGDTVQGE